MKRRKLTPNPLRPQAPPPPWRPQIKISSGFGEEDDYPDLYGKFDPAGWDMGAFRAALRAAPDIESLKIYFHCMPPWPALPPEIFTSPQLAEFSIVVENFEVEPGDPCIALPLGLGRLKNLKEFFTFHINFAKFPEELFSLPQLEQIAISGSSITTIPDQFDELPHLELFHLTDSPITSLPPSLVRLPKLNRVLIAGTAIDTLPANLLNNPSVKFVNLCGTRIKEADFTSAHPYAERWAAFQPPNFPWYGQNYRIMFDKDVVIYVDPPAGRRPGDPLPRYYSFEDNRGQVQVDDIARHLPALLDGRLDPAFYPRFLAEGSPGLHNFILDRLPSDHPLAMQIVDQRRVTLPKRVKTPPTVAGKPPKKADGGPWDLIL